MPPDSQAKLGKEGKLSLLLFTNDVSLALQAQRSRVARVLIDLERRGKLERQHGYHLEINNHKLEDIRRMKRFLRIPVVARINSWHEDSLIEVEDVLRAGADAIMLPMFKSVREVEDFARVIDRRCLSILLLETREAVEEAEEIARIDCDEVYVGLNDLALSYELSFSYEVLQSGVIDHLRSVFSSKPFGFGGITIVGGGCPLPTELILKEMARLNCQTAIVRRAFRRDVVGRDMNVEVERIQEVFLREKKREKWEVERDRVLVKSKIREIVAGIEDRRTRSVLFQQLQGGNRLAQASLGSRDWL
jgi:hypothetical protein